MPCSSPVNKNEADGAAGNRAGGFDYAGGVNHEGCVAAVVESAGAEFPGIEMSAEDYEFVRLFAAANFRDDVFGIDGAGNVVGELEMHADFLSGGDEAGHALGIFARDDGLR